MSHDQKIDHLFRHEYGKMVSSLTRIFGVKNLELIEDAVQDSFHKAVVYFRNHELPDNPAAWLQTMAKNRTVDLFRKLKAKNKYEILSGPSVISMNEVFSELEIEDNQLRLLFTICHPSLNIKDQIIFALKSFSGFSHNEIAHALLITNENIKKSLFRARKNIDLKNIEFKVPEHKELINRLENVHLVLYLLFIEGFHSSSKGSLIRRDLVAEALRLNGLLVDRFQNANSKALMAMMCFHAARLDSKITTDDHLIKLKHQDRSSWNRGLIMRGNILLDEAIEADVYSRFHWEAAIAGEYVKAQSFEMTNWNKLEQYHRNLIALIPSAVNRLNLCVIVNLLGRNKEALHLINEIDFSELKGKEYLYYSVLAEIYRSMGDDPQTLHFLHLALKTVENPSEEKLINAKIKSLAN